MSKIMVPAGLGSLLPAACQMDEQGAEPRAPGASPEVIVGAQNEERGA